MSKQPKYNPEYVYFTSLRQLHHYVLLAGKKETETDRLMQMTLHEALSALAMAGIQTQFGFAAGRMQIPTVGPNRTFGTNDPPVGRRPEPPAEPPTPKR